MSGHPNTLKTMPSPESKAEEERAVVALCAALTAAGAQATPVHDVLIKTRQTHLPLMR
jgi:hypothetical protein